MFELIQLHYPLILLNSSVNLHQCMGKAGMFDCGCICFRKPVEFNSHPSQKIIEF